MKNLTYNRAKLGEYTVSNDLVNESVLTRAHYKLAEFTGENGEAYAININNKFAYPIVGKRFDSKMKAKHPQFSDARCMTTRVLTIDELR